MNKIGYFRRRMADLFEAHDFYGASDIGESLIREHWHIKTIHTVGYAMDVYNLGRVNDELDELERAAFLYSDASNLLVAHEGAADAAYIACVNNLGIVLNRLGMDEPASRILSQLTAYQHHRRIKCDIKFADCLYNLANVAAGLGRKKQALQWHKEALDIRKKEGLPEDVLHSLHSLAFLYEKDEKYEKAADLAESALSVAHGDDYARACYHLAMLYESGGQSEKALALYEETATLMRERVGRAHDAYLFAFVRRAHLLHNLGRWEESLAMYNELSRRIVATEGADNHGYAEVLHQKAMLYQEMGDIVKAEQLMLESMKIRVQIKDKDLMVSVNFLMRLYLDDGWPNKALEVLVLALMHSEHDEPGTIQFFEELAEVFRETERIDLNEVLASLHSINQHYKVSVIMAKWRAWETEEVQPDVLDVVDLDM